MAPTPRPSILRKVFEEQLSLLAGEMDALFQSEVAAREAEARNGARTELAEELNQALRRLRHADNFQQVSAILADSSASYCNTLAIFSVSESSIRAERLRGLEEDLAAERFATLEFPVAQAAAFGLALESADPVVAMCTGREVSAPVVEIFRHKPEDRAFILPVIVHQKPVGLLYASGSVEMVPLELLAQAAALSLEARMPPPDAARPGIPRPELVTLQPDQPKPVPKRKIPEKWGELTPEDQQLHLRAQRFARVQVAGMRLFSPEAVNDGRARKDLYGALQTDIDAGREIFRQTFLSATPTMLDYFHLELLRTLAHDDPALLGDKYPGPLL